MEKLSSGLKAIIALILVVVPGPWTGASPLGDLLDRALAEDDQWFLLVQDRELAELRLERALIEATGELDEVGARLAYHSSRADLARQTVQVIQARVDAAHALQTAVLDLDIATVRLESARDDLRLAEQRYRSGLLSLEALADQRGGLRTLESELASARWTRDDALRAFSQAFALEEALPEVPAPILPLPPTPDMGTWQEGDHGLIRARYALRQGELRLENLARDAAPFDRRLAELEVLRARRLMAAAEEESRRAHESLVFRLDAARAVLELREADHRSRTQAVQDSLARYRGGQASLAEYNNSRINALNAAKQVATAERTVGRLAAELWPYRETLGEGRP